MNTEIPAPTFEWMELAPVLVVLVAACVGMLIEALVKRSSRFISQILVAEVGLLASAFLLVMNWQDGRQGNLVMGSVTLDAPAYMVWLALLIFGLLALSVFAERSITGASAFVASAASLPGSHGETQANEQGREHSEVFPLALFSLSGMMVFVAAGDLLTMFIALEVMSLPLYLLSGLARSRRLLSQEAALKYFLLGSFASAFFLFGIALLYGYAGSFQISALAQAVMTPKLGDGFLFAGMVLLAVGLLFKIGAVPFQSWVPDVYTGAPTPVTGFMAICTKLAAVVALTRVFFVAFGGERWTWQPVLAIIAIITMAVGVILALTQQNIKRLLAYSAVSHAGFLLTALVGAFQDVPEGQLNALGSMLFYLIAYGFATIAAFAMITLVRDSGGEANDIKSWSGLAAKNPLLAIAFAVVLFSFAGIPLTGGFIGKWAVFAAAWAGGFSWLAITAVAFSLVAVYIYLKVMVEMFFGKPVAEVSVAKPSWFTILPIAVGALGSLYLGIFPGHLLELLTLSQVFGR